ncbi:hypothetical protein JMJ77_0002531 [Colletotrichum scovillei]|uniref:Uncharacterized protein n=1 Tax=Colletotrichum scovillei TaxID=1209932 RepID=A0A9P7UDE8_9PEZI|nr:hypothetical protein JMJ77_0002531 [Colletotrichum scovillei]KAG7070953.1 hypothetical protein JMJ76_0002194 [Colletotrichum scovillei]KAG7079233.1 hypothetical protein JMJ78_0002889 [Colletotrichum scovillei]
MFAFFFSSNNFARVNANAQRYAKRITHTRTYTHTRSPGKGALPALPPPPSALD